MKKEMFTAAVLTIIAAANAAIYASAQEDVALISQQSNGYTITIDGEILSAANAYASGDVVMIPLRATAEKLGYTVEWNGELQSVFLDNGEVNTTVYIGVDSYYTASSTMIGMSAPESLGAAPELVNDVTYVPAKLFAVLINDENGAVIDGDVIKLSSEKYLTDNSSAVNIGENVQIPNPFVNYDSVDEAKKQLAYDVKVPSYVPDGYKIDNIGIMSGEMIQITYKYGDDEITFRASKTTDDITGDYNTYSNIYSKKVSGIDVSFRGNDKTAGASWTDGGITYSIYADKEISEEDMIKIIEKQV